MKHPSYNENIIYTKIQKSSPEFIYLRKMRINEAISFRSGTTKRPFKTIIAKLSDDKEVYFKKPGKETTRKIPNKYDMQPNVGNKQKSYTEGFTFEPLWEYLIKISIINQITFKKVLILLYRICYFIDHKEISKNKLRYYPSQEISDYINKLDFSLRDGFKDKFKKYDLELLVFLYFVDILGWNEDVKYHIECGKITFKGKYPVNAGRVNTIKSIISVPLMVNDFLSNIIDNVKHIEKINVRLILATMQKFSKSRGICVMTNKELVEHLFPFLEK